MMPYAKILWCLDDMTQWYFKLKFNLFSRRYDFCMSLADSVLKDDLQSLEYSLAEGWKFHLDFLLLISQNAFHKTADPVTAKLNFLKSLKNFLTVLNSISVVYIEFNKFKDPSANGCWTTIDWMAPERLSATWARASTTLLRQSYIYQRTTDDGLLVNVWRPMIG